LTPFGFSASCSGTLQSKTINRRKTMKKRISHISPLQAGIVEGALMGIMTLIFVPFFLIATLLGHGGFGVIFVIFIPLIYAVVGFIAGVIAAFVYNLIAKFTGGIEITLTDAP
jgi:hypothetical protein